MARRKTRRTSSTRRPGRRILETRAPRRGTVIVAGVLYIVGLFGYAGLLPLSPDVSMVLLAIAGGLLLLGALLRDL